MDYEAICLENIESYGTAIGRIGPMLLADRYDDRTHFIFELLQNAEDAIGRRGNWSGSRKVDFILESNCLVFSHFGKPFDGADVRGVCGIAESTKDKNSIGRFGIGFKSVYTFTKRPEIHSGEEDFAVENYVLPRRLERRKREHDETQIVLPLMPEDQTAQREIIEGFKRLGASALLFLRSIEEINWRVGNEAYGSYLRSPVKNIGSNVQLINVIGHQSSHDDDVDQNWLVFQREVTSVEDEKVGRVEVAFNLQANKDDPKRWTVHPVATSPLVVFFPTVVSTNLGFLVQGPYRTTPSRDNISKGNVWNQKLVAETANLLVEGMRWLRDNEMLQISAIRCLPLDRKKFPEDSIFSPLFEAVQQSFKDEPLLPMLGGGYTVAVKAKLARTQELRELFNSEQLSQLFKEQSVWLTGEITPDKEPEIRDYVMNQLNIIEVTPDMIISRLNEEFLVSQTDEWIGQLYEFLNGQKAALRRHIDSVPLLRLTDDSHVRVFEEGKPNAFFSSNFETGFQTIKSNVYSSTVAREFLVSLGITEPDTVDDVIRNILPKYQKESIDVDDDEYAVDISRIFKAFDTDSKSQREMLLSEIRKSNCLMVIDRGNGKEYAAKPEEAYLATERLKQLYAGIEGILIIDEKYECLLGEGMRSFLEACGALRHPRLLPIDGLTYDQRLELRIQAGHSETSYRSDKVDDYDLEGIEAVINLLPTLPLQERNDRARLIWESLSDLLDRRGLKAFEGVYTWTHHGSYKKEFDVTFLKYLNSASWIPSSNGELQPPSFVVFENLGWKENPFLLSKVKFKPPIIEQLALEAGIDPATLDFLKKHGLTNVADLANRLGINESTVMGEPESDIELEPNSSTIHGNVYDELDDLYGDEMPEFPPIKFDPEGGEVIVRSNEGKDHNYRKDGSVGAQNGDGNKLGISGSSTVNGKIGGTSGGNSGKRTPGQGGGRPFISYVAAHLNDESDTDPDGLDQANRMRIEALAIEQIIKKEPKLNRTPEGNPGFDLFEVDTSGKPVRWVEVKSMTGSLADRPVGISRTQFDFAREHGSAFWLYVVEYATNPENLQILRIQDPIAHARTFTFDSGWIHIASTELPNCGALST